MSITLKPTLYTSNRRNWKDADIDQCDLGTNVVTILRTYRCKLRRYGQTSRI
jgi:hypothetical protein